MNKEELEHFEDLIVKAIQSTKSENSGLVADIKKDINELKGNYSKRELDHFITEIKENVIKILDQTTKTNGRVNKLENHKAYLWGAFSIVTVLGGVIITLSIIAIDSKISKAVEQALLNNVSTIYYEK